MLKNSSRPTKCPARVLRLAATRTGRTRFRNEASCSVKRLLVFHKSRKRGSRVQHREQIGPE